MVLFFLTSRKNAAGPKGQAFEASHEEAQVSSGHPKGRVMRTWQSPYEIIRDGCDAGGHRYQPSQRPCSIIYVCIDTCIYIHRYIHTNSNVYIYIYVDQYIYLFCYTFVYIFSYTFGITTNYAVSAFIRSDENLNGVVGSYTDQSP